MRKINSNFRFKTLRHWVSMPFILGMAIPIAIFDLCIEIYQHICFPLYDIPLVNRHKYIKIDRHKLKYLNFTSKLGCAYCGYANGSMAYWIEIAGRTESYWCGIKHKYSKTDFFQPHQANFLEYGDDKEYKKRYSKEETTK